MKIDGLGIADLPVMSSANQDDLLLIVQNNALKLQSYNNLTGTFSAISGSFKVDGIALPKVDASSVPPTDELVLIVENNGLAVKQVGIGAPSMPVGSFIDVDGVQIPSIRFSGNIDGDELCVAIRNNNTCLIPIPLSFSVGALPISGRLLFAPLKSSLVLSEGTGSPIFTRTTKAWGFNELGYLEELASGCAFFGGARLVRNTVRTTSEDFSNAAWTKVNCTTPSANVVVCANATSAQYINQEAAGGTSLTVGTRMAYSYRVKRVVGGVNFLQIVPWSTTYGSSQFVNVSLLDGSYAATGCSATVTAVSADTFDVTIFPTVTVTGIDVCTVAMINAMSDIRLPSFIGDGVKSFELLRAWSVDVTNYDASYVPEYVSVGVNSAPFPAGIDGAKYFETDWQGAPIPAANLLGFRREPAATNNLLQSRNLTQNVWGSPANGGIGSELLTNGAFDSATDWTRSGAAYWSVSGGVLNLNAADSSASYYDNSQTYALLVTGKQYVVEFDYVHTSGAAPTVTLRGADGKPLGNSTGRKTLTITCGSSVAGYGIRIGTFAAAVGTIDNLTIKEAPVQCAQTAIGIDGVANTATTLTAAVADAIILQPITLASAARCASVYVKRRTGTGTISFTQDGGSTWTDITSQINSSAYSRVQITSTLANPSVGFKISTSGDAVDVDVVQNEAGSVATSPIITTTATVTRNGDVLTYPTTSNIDFAAGTLYGEGLFANAAVTRRIAVVGSDGYSYSNSVDPYTTWKAYDGTNIVQQTGLSDTTTATRKRVVAWGGGTMKVTGDGLAPASGSFDGSFGGASTIDIGQSCIGYIRNIAIYNYKMTDAELQGITA